MLFRSGGISAYHTPPKAKMTFRRKGRDSILSPGSLRAEKSSRTKDDAWAEKVHVMIKAEVNSLRSEIEREMLANVDAYKKDMYALRVESQATARAEIKVMECVMQKRLDDACATFETFKANVEKRANEKDAVIEELKRELAAGRPLPGKEGENEPSMEKELENIREQVKTLQEEEQQKSRTTSSWVEVLTQTQKKVDEAEKWIEVEKKGKAKMLDATPTSTIINMTIEEEQKRKTRALHVRVTGVKDTGNVEEEMKELLQRMGIPEPTHTGAWRVGKKGIDGKGNVKEKALILRFPTMESRKEFLKKRPALKQTGIFMGDDLTLAQITHMQELMPEIKAAREKGKIAFYRGGKVVVLEKRTA